MSDKTGIEWTDATWNPVTGCTKVSAGCDHCYAETIAHRFAGTKAYPNAFDVTLRPERLVKPLIWQRPRRIFVNSMSDLFHERVPDEYIAKVFAVMASAPRHTFQVLTKRHGRVRSLLSSTRFQDLASGFTRINEIRSRADGEWMWPLPNVWLGVSVETQRWADIRIPALLGTPAAIRFISAEPLLGHVDLRWRVTVPRSDAPHIDWVIAGGESGQGARPMHPDWPRSLRDQCNDAGIAFLFKQWGQWAPDPDSTDPSRTLVGAEPMRRVGKKAAGRELDGRTWDEYPS